MFRARLVALVCVLALPSRVCADVTVIYAPAAARAPLIARTVAATEAGTGAGAGAETETGAGAGAGAESGTGAETETETETEAETETGAETGGRTPAPAVPRARPVVPEACSAPVVLVRITDGSRERRSLPLLDCEGRPDAESLAALSILVRPAGVPLPEPAALAAHAGDRDWIAPSIRRVHPGLLERLRVIADAFPGHAIELLSGSRPDARPGSRHLHGLALDLRVAGASLAALHALVSRFDRTGVGLYSAADFVHIDVRSRSVRWIDRSGPGEPPLPEPTDAPPRARRIRRAPPPAPRPRTDVATGEIAIDGADTIDVDDADAIADEVTRGLGERWTLPTPPLPTPPR